MLENEYISREALPGQFIHIQLDGFTLRRPISIADTDEQAGTFTILFKIVGDGTKSLANYEVGKRLDVLGPNGQGFPIDDLHTEASVLLIGGGIGVPPIYFLAKKLKERNLSVRAILGFQTKDYVFYEEEFKALAETRIVTDDGSYGDRGFVTNYIAAEGLDRYYACGPFGMLRAVKHSLPDLDGYLSFEERMACGIGACYACVLPVNAGLSYKKVCKDGPVLSAREVVL